jgi:multisubunit Na+/H+ antiporter MnhG subunit
MLFATHMLIFIEGWLNLVNNSVQVSEGANGLRILYTFLFILIFNPLAMFLFYRGYAGLCRDKSYLSLFIYLQPIAIILWLAFSIINFLGFNGFIRVADLYNKGYSAAGTLSLIESLIFLGEALLGSFVYYKICGIRSSLASKLAPRLL